MSKERNVSNEMMLNFLIELREKDAKMDSFTDIKINREKCRAIGLFGYAVENEKETRASTLFLISEVHDGNEVEIIYDNRGKFIAWVNHENNKEGELTIAQDIKLDRPRLERQLQLQEEREQVREEESNGTTSDDDTSKNESEKDIAKDKKDEEEKKDQKEEEPKKDEEEKEEPKLKNLKNEISMSGRVQIRLDEIINGYYLWDILGIEESLKGRLPAGISEKSFRTGYLTIIESSELTALDGKERQAEDTFALCTSNGDIIEIDDQVMEPEYLGTRQERKQQEDKSIRYADGEETAKPETDINLARTSKWKIKNANTRFAVNEDWYLSVDNNREWIDNGTNPINGKKKEISFVQETIQNDKVYSKDSSEARTRESIAFKLEDISEPPLNEKEQKQNEQLRNKDPNEEQNVRKEHVDGFKKVVEELTIKYGEDNRKTIEGLVEEEHKKGKSPEDTKKIVKDEMESVLDEYYRYGRSRRG